MGAFTGVSEQDLRRLLDVVAPDPAEDDTADDDIAEIPERVLRGLAELIPSACASFFVMDTRGRRVTAAQEALLADLPDEDEGSDALFFDAYWDCAACSWPELSGDHTTVTMWTDFHSEREYAGMLMGEYARRMGVWHELLVCLPPQGRLERRILLAREGGDRPYTERDRLLLTLLRPHLIRLRDHVEARRRTVPTLTSRQLELLRRVADGHTNRQIARDLGLSEGTVRKHLEHIYARLEVRSRTEALARMRDVLAG
ncbi:MAG TPA: LuxR C-terminal-related transcriptional regulator [Candidatus Angelobacter sp.]|nr:LuxR C-terminal-related transcriptional regulator [Candidatus Angelobacter sp.]